MPFSWGHTVFIIAIHAFGSISIQIWVFYLILSVSCAHIVKHFMYLVNLEA